MAGNANFNDLRIAIISFLLSVNGCPDPLIGQTGAGGLSDAAVLTRISEEQMAPAFLPACLQWPL